MVEKRDRAQILLAEIPTDNAMSASVQISGVESRAIDEVISHSVESEERVWPMWGHIPKEVNEISSVLSEISPILDDEELCRRLEAMNGLGKLKSSIGSCNAVDGDLINEQDDWFEESDDHMMDQLFNDAEMGNIDLDEIMISATQAGKTKGENAADLAKVWRIDL